MGGHLGFRLRREAIAQRFGAQGAAEAFRPRSNVVPSQSLPVILNEDPHTIQLLAWGLRPAWMTKKEGLIHVRAETLRDRTTFQEALARRRCLVPADGFYVWKKEGKHKMPYRVCLQSGDLFAFAGLWEENRGEDGQPLRTFALITTDANALVSQVQHRMPVILRQEAEPLWLAKQSTQEHLLSLLSPYPATLMRMSAVSPRVNGATADEPKMSKPRA